PRPPILLWRERQLLGRPADPLCELLPVYSRTIAVCGDLFTAVFLRLITEPDGPSMRIHAKTVANFLVLWGCVAPLHPTAAEAATATIDGHPDSNGIWQAVNTANWNLEVHSAQALDEFWKLGAIAAVPAGRSVVQGSIP